MIMLHSKARRQRFNTVFNNIDRVNPYEEEQAKHNHTWTSPDKGTENTGPKYEVIMTTHLNVMMKSNQWLWRQTDREIVKTENKSKRWHKPWGQVKTNKQKRTEKIIIKIVVVDIYCEQIWNYSKLLSELSSIFFLHKCKWSQTELNLLSHSIVTLEQDILIYICRNLIQGWCQIPTAFV